MTRTQRKQFTEKLLEVVLDDDLFTDLETVGNEILEGERDWAYLIALDESLSASASDSYTTAKALSGLSNFVSPVSLYVGSDTIPYDEIKFQQRERYKNLSRRYYINYANNNLYLTGGSTGTIHLWFKQGTGEITAATTLKLPSRYHRLLGFYVAGVYQGGVDWDTISARMSPENKLQAQLLKNAMIQWDGNIQARGQGFRTGDGDIYLNPSHPNYLDTDNS